MKLKNFTELNAISKERGFNAIGSFNLHNLEALPAYFSAAVETNTPLMIQISTGTAKFLGYELLVDSVKSLSRTHNVPACLHLDHCSIIDDIQVAIDAGFSSVMYDGSHLPIRENIANTKKVIDIAKPLNITVEAELGAIGGAEDGQAIADEDIAFTKVEDAVKLLSEAPVDMLAVSIGTVHGSYTAKTDIQHDLLCEIAKATSTPLVLHGGTGVSNDDMHFVVKNGIDKVNVGTEMNVQWVRKCKETFESGKVNDSVRKFLIPANEAVKNTLVDKISLFK
ncbi:class II fructose-bisphosphate aldolase family protein [Vibrio sp. DW001]|uniref:class II fructose-bisphosphate aldolase n=1 Tax=Vibrio sp. DW001 TaxID=2912315 RepID=UPI0023AF49B9|nr:class II fructose-bisphosphate aldolase [Vibrio sp. DW001]WED25938.1 class II fructose-bisphosphate aldolase family protein [Vibrio sp. DW001]